ncbi:SRPBCC family protein [Phaeocystidibacter luteus]|uniref:SRPBCC family protein n=1 Tax=Phaeocystidibacter luteus TaxID=911197 RepID=A0A6N6RLH5_9FLAO|nr:SRPBCC family protein [Phaeocystidibacter luteus]KAB2814422.1 SRPBCC family protein [Phaeocystidibacter luteus]
MYTLKRTQRLPISIDEAWKFFSSPSNLQEITPEDMGFDIISEVPKEMYEGLFIHYKVSPLLGIKLNWTTEITHIRDRQFFVDEQRVGPYKIWHHEHHFKEIDGGVEMTDIVSYQLPMGVLGRMMHPLIVKNRLNQIFDYRFEIIEKKFGTVKPEAK